MIQAIESSKFARMETFDRDDIVCFDLDGTGHRCDFFSDGDEWVITDYRGEIARGATPAEAIEGVK
ncbi:MAG: hypothetical protein KUG67_02560 [Proteobacteria bacterium]|nr:hypothetical protein [Pseudomonadota bacterium]